MKKALRRAAIGSAISMMFCGYSFANYAVYESENLNVDWTVPVNMPTCSIGNASIDIGEVPQNKWVEQDVTLTVTCSGSVAANYELGVLREGSDTMTHGTIYGGTIEAGSYVDANGNTIYLALVPKNESEPWYNFNWTYSDISFTSAGYYLHSQIKETGVVGTKSYNLTAHMFVPSGETPLVGTASISLQAPIQMNIIL